MPNFGKCNLHIPHKDLSTDLDVLRRQELENYATMERWSRTLLSDCMSGGSCAFDIGTASSGYSSAQVVPSDSNLHRISWDGGYSFCGGDVSVSTDTVTDDTLTILYPASDHTSLVFWCSINVVWTIQDPCAGSVFSSINGSQAGPLISDVVNGYDIGTPILGSTIGAPDPLADYRLFYHSGSIGIFGNPSGGAVLNLEMSQTTGFDANVQVVLSYYVTCSCGS